MVNITYKIIFTLLLLISQLQANDIRALFFHGNCVTCHFENRSHSAPSIQEIKQRYKDAFTNKVDFVYYMSEWVLKPNAQTSLMSDAIDKYELMPDLGYDADTLKKISSYIYETEFDKKHQGHKK